MADYSEVATEERLRRSISEPALLSRSKLVMMAVLVLEFAIWRSAPTSHAMTSDEMI